MAFHSALIQDSKKSRSIDRRRETSRYAARDRRGKEADIFSDLKDVVPVVDESTVTHVDRIALLRVASTLCRMRKHAGPFFTNELVIEDNPNIWNENTLSECLDGFVILVDSDGTMLYITESVSIFLGLTQTDLVGRGIKDFIHPTDYDELMRISTEEAAASEEQRSPNGEEQIHRYGHRMIMRMKTVISPRGRNLNLKSALFKAIVCRCRSIQLENSRIMLIHGSTTPAGQGNSICMTNASVKGSETTSGSFMTRHTCDMRFSYVSENFNYLLRHESRSLMGASFYDLVHPADLNIISDTMGELFRKGHCRSPYYRLIGANNSVAWVQTEATTVNHTTRGQKGQYILCVHSLVGMQSELDSWITAGSVCSDVLGAAKPACQYIKAEIDDVAEYLGRQPQYIDCHDFTPLIDSDAGINMSEYRPMRDVAQNQRQVYNNPPRRKDSYNEVLEWLFRDQPESPSTNPAIICNTYEYGTERYDNRFGNQCSQQQFEYNNEQSRNSTIESRRNDRMVRMGGNGANTKNKELYLDSGRGYSRSDRRENSRNNTITTFAMDDTNRFTNRTIESSTVTRNRNENNTKSKYNDGIVGRNERTRTTAISKGLLCDTGYGEKYIRTGNCITSEFSPLTAGFAEFGVGSPDEISRFGNNCRIKKFNNDTVVTIGNKRNEFTNVSAVSNNSYNVSNVGEFNIEGPVYESNTNMQPVMSSTNSKIEEKSTTLNVDILPVVGTPQQISKEFFEEFKQQNPHLFPKNSEKNLIDDMCNSYQCSSDSFEHLAPFVPEEDILQLNSEPFPLDVTFPELDLSGYSFDTNFGKTIQPNPYSEKQIQYMKTQEDGSNIPAKRPRIVNDNPYQPNY